MPYNSYYPATYNPYNYLPSYQPIVQAPQAMQNQQQIQAVQPQPAQSIIWVSGDSEASVYPIAPNSAVTLWSQSEPVVYLKQADASGKPTLTTYDLVERTGRPPESKTSEDDRLSAYATKEEFTTIVAAVNGLNVMLSSIKSELSSMREDLGMTKKAHARKTEADDE